MLQPKRDHLKQKASPPVGPYLNLGLQLAIAVAIGFGIGYVLDVHLHTQPIFIVLGVLMGATAGMMNIYRVVYPPKDEQKRPRK